MRVVKDLLAGCVPATMDLFYNAALAADGGTLIYKGSLAKVMDVADVDHGRFVTFGGNATAELNAIGILEEEVPAASGNGYLPDSGTYGMIRRKITPIFPSTLIRAEYMRADEAGTANYETLSASVAGTTLTGSAVTTDDLLIGGWVYFYTGNNAGRLHYITNSANASAAITIATATAHAVLATDRVLVILPAMVNKLDLNATYTGIKSDTDDGNWDVNVVGLNHWVSAPGVRMQPLNRNIHDGTNIGPNARFFHDFTLPDTNVWITSTD